MLACKTDNLLLYKNESWIDFCISLLSQSYLYDNVKTISKVFCINICFKMIVLLTIFAEQVNGF